MQEGNSGNVSSFLKRCKAYLEAIGRYVVSGGFLKWICYGAAIGILTGSASALFLAALETATQKRLEHPWLLFLLPFGGAFVSYAYLKFGGSAVKGNNLILEQIHSPQERIPLRMAPLVLLGTVVTHLLGGSAGREGTAVQMGGSLAEWVGKRLKVGDPDRAVLLMSGISGGFGSVFGTPLAGAIFGLEVIAIGRIRFKSLLPCLTASFVGDLVTKAWGIKHIQYAMGDVPAIGWLVLAKVLAASVLFGLTSLLFSKLTHGFKGLFTRIIPHAALKSFIGGLIIIGLVYAAGTRDYLGLGIPLLVESFQEPVQALAFLWKTLFTSITLGAGFQGGEVTPLFVIGATMGNALGSLLQLSLPFMAGIGLIAVFCGATNTPLACFILGLELFGSDAMVYLLIAAIVSYLCSGHSGIYSAQRIGIRKTRWLGVDAALALAQRHKKSKHKDK
ncbi:voltage-gated chloride channel family protein [Paenibacillus nasutitermitis]|uniref:Chloride/fluoride channel protein n=1 Tax=Paenibacillus nasutitermitis TaxID=1652958 RepID=A0A916YVI5_9BACL|nr:voltage-gated chloride channel family protein [Paenibacillus nasutitermitis]GGD63190.1 chloride/fluoride channel protein [Paenibacillus nasutitermitis]